MGHYTSTKKIIYIGDIKIHNEVQQDLLWFENQGRTFLAEDEPLGKVVYGNGNNKKMDAKEFITRTSLACPRSILSRNAGGLSPSEHCFKK